MNSETPGFEETKNQFNLLNLTVLVDQPVRIDGIDREVITEAYNKLKLYFDDRDYRNTLTLNRKRNIESQIVSILAQLNRIAEMQRNGIIIGSESEMNNLIANIQNSLEDLDLRFYQPYQVYILQGKENTAEIINDLNRQRDNAENTTEELNQLLNTSRISTGQTASLSLADHYQRLANGLSIDENDKRISKEIKLKNSYFYVPSIILGLLILFFQNDTLKFYDYLISNLNENIIRIIGILIILIGVAIPHILRKFKDLKPGGYDRTASIWMLIIIFTFVSTLIYTLVLVRELGNVQGWEQLVPKLISLLIPAYIIRFSVQNFRISKHLTVINTHKAVVARTANAFANQISTPLDSLKKDELNAHFNIIDKAATVVFEPNATGYITTKEGAGVPNETIFDGISLPNK